MVLRKLLTYSITAVILGGSFAIIFFLSREQVNNSNDAFLSFVISFSITVINIIIQSTSFLTHSRHSRPNKFRKRRDPHELPKRTGLEIYFRSGHQLDLVALRCQVLHPREFVQSWWASLRCLYHGYHQLFPYARLKATQPWPSGLPYQSLVL